MALTGISRGTGGNNTAATSLTITPAANFAAGSMAILALAYDNAGAQGADPFSSITDNTGNTWTLRTSGLNDPGAASAGCAARIYTCSVVSLGTGTTVTVSFGAISVTAKAWTLTEVTAAVNFAPSFVIAGNSTNSGTIITLGITTGANNFFLACLGAEGSSTITAANDSLNGAWSTQQTTGFGTTTAGIHISSQYKITTGSQANYNPTLGTSEDWVAVYMEVTEVSTLSTSFDPMGQMGFFGI